MADWTASMQQTFEYYTVDSNTWKDKTKIEYVKSCSITWDSETETLCSASIDVDDLLEECYVRIYLITIQNGIREKHTLGTFLVQNPGFSFDGKTKTSTVDAYSPLLELKDNPPPIGYYTPKNKNIMDEAYTLIEDNSRLRVVKASCTDILYYDFVAETDDTWITYLIDLVSNANYTIMLDELGQVLFYPKQDTASLQPVWTYNDDNSSILYPELTMSRDLYGIPNTVEVVYSDGDYNYYATATNDDVNSPISTVNRGRKITYRTTNPNIPGVPSGNKEHDLARVEEYAKQALRELSTIEYSITYTHGYCPVRIGDCVRLNYSRSGINNVKAKVISQSIKCETGCSVTEKAVYTTSLWG